MILITSFKHWNRYSGTHIFMSTNLKDVPVRTQRSWKSCREFSPEKVLGFLPFWHRLLREVEPWRALYYYTNKFISQQNTIIRKYANPFHCLPLESLAIVWGTHLQTSTFPCMAARCSGVAQSLIQEIHKYDKYGYKHCYISNKEVQTYSSLGVERMMAISRRRVLLSSVMTALITSVRPCCAAAWSTPISSGECTLILPRRRWGEMQQC